MADFNVDMTSPQGGATQVVSPVQVSPVPEFNINQAIAAGANLFGDFLQNKNKADAAAAQNSVISEYSQSEDRIAQLVKTGGLTATEARSRSQSNFSKYIGSNPGLYKDLEAVRKSRMEGTATGDVYDEVKANKAREERGNLLAEGFGIPSYEHTSPETQKANREAAYLMKRQEVEFKQKTERSQEARAVRGEQRSEKTFENQMQDRQDVEDASVALNELVKVNFKSFNSAMADEVKFVSTSTNPEAASVEAQMRITERLATIQAQATAVGGARSQELVAPYLKSFKEMADLTIAMTKPGADVDLLKQKVERLKLTSMATLLADPAVASLSQATVLFGNNPDVILKASKPALTAIARTTATLSTDPLYATPQIVGNPAVESPALDIIRDGLETLQQDKDVFGTKAKLTEECKNSVNVCLRQTEAIVKQGATPQALTKIMSFYASPAFGKAASVGMLDNQALNGATEAYDVYGRAVVSSVSEELKKYVGPIGRSQGVPQTMGEVVDLNFSGGKVNFVPIDKSSRSAEGAKAMKKSEDAITHLVFVGAHLSGTQDYAKYWETNKHKILPNMYYDSAKYPIGVVVKQGDKQYEYIGGPHKAARSWKEVKQNATGN